MTRPTALTCLALIAALLPACRRAPPSSAPAEPSGPERALIEAAPKPQRAPAPPKTELERVTQDLGKGDRLVAQIETSLGALECELAPELAPRTVANFVGLARGLVPFRADPLDDWTEGVRYYDETTFHRVLPGFLIQAGRREQDAPGFSIESEFHPELRHDAAGVLSMAQRGAESAGAEFFITLAPSPHLDGRHAAFGRCGPETVLAAIAAAPTDAEDRPIEAITIERVTVRRISGDL